MWKTLLLVALAVGCHAQAPVAAPASGALVKGVGNFIHNVADLDQSIHFYKDILGMEVPRPAGNWQDTDAVLKLYNAIGGKFRVGTVQVTGVAMRIELAEFQGVDRKPVKRTLGMPGTSLLLLTVTDLQPVLDRLKAANIPLTSPLREGCDGRGMAVADPDGFQIVIVQKGPPTAPAVAGRAYTNLRFGYTVGGNALLNGPFKALKLEGTALAYQCQPVEFAVLSDPAPVTVRLPDGFEILLVKSFAKVDDVKLQDPESLAIRPQDPGAAVLRLAVNDIEAAVQALTEAGTKVVSAGGAIQTLAPGTTKAAILGAPDGLFIQVLK